MPYRHEWEREGLRSMLLPASLLIASLTLAPALCAAQSGGSVACLPPKDAKKVQKANSPVKRVLIYLSIGKKQINLLAYCVSPPASWSERPDWQSCPPLSEILSLNDCVWGEVLREARQLHVSGKRSIVQLQKAREEVVGCIRSMEMAEGRGEQSSPVRHHLRSIRHRLEDVEDAIKSALSRAAQ